VADVPSIRRILLDEIATESGATRRTLERVPQERWAWSPHEKSMPMGRLASWTARMLSGVPTVLRESSTDMANWNDMLPAPEGAAALADTFDRSVALAREALEAASEATLGETWTMMHGDQVLWGPVPRYAVVRGFFLADMIHHRAQLGVYLRLLGLSVPAVYGPSADEQA